ncbi:MAG TPA: DUF1634 domain-containing protein [Terriglobia bacterium]|nr:DUF1634 domain-containing protein [Terriglobia bacterium]
MTKIQWTDQRTEMVIGGLLRTGVILSAVLVVLGGAVYLVRHGMDPPSYHVFRGEPSDLRNVKGILRQVRAGRGRGIIQLGLLLLIATPVARVAFSVVAFALERDRLYVVITLIVLAVLAFSLAGGHF